AVRGLGVQIPPLTKRLRVLLGPGRGWGLHCTVTQEPLPSPMSLSLVRQPTAGSCSGTPPTP
ncbi:unnamed protein product, partial [Rangifer tarandus platyrhynchus]